MTKLQEWTNTIQCMDCLEGMKELPDKSIDLVVTSPPYNCRKEYENWGNDKEYYQFITSIGMELKRILKPDGRVAWNVASTITQNGDIKPVGFQNWICLNESLKFRDFITWDQLNSENDTAWGSFDSASSPYFRHQTEMVLIWYNEVWKKIEKGKSTIPKGKFPLWTLDLWRISVARRQGHPCPFPIGLASRLINLLTYENDLILDCMIGSGTTALAAKNLGRRYIGFEINPDYCKIAEDRLRQEILL